MTSINKYLISLDLEMNQPCRCIIEIGLTFYNTLTDEYTKVSKLVKPKCKLNDEITYLTGITQTELMYAPALEEVVLNLRLKYEKYFSKAHPQIIVWSQGDMELLDEKLGKSFSDIIGMYKSYIDCKPLYQSWRLKNNKYVFGGLSRAVKELGLTFQGKPHRAADDAHNTLIIFNQLYLYRK
tara:strand:+ start:488 stop:1033 length:546 start_codon:yes stop_codon:yes gene_type:complete